MAHPLAEAQDLMEGWPRFTQAEKDRIRDLELPDHYLTAEEYAIGNNHWPRRVNMAEVKRWRREHRAKLRSLERNR